jgi:nuclease S1
MLLLTALLAAADATAPVGPAWSAMGHRLVVEIAWDNLTPRARASVLDLLGAERLADASVWADRIRPERPATGPLHYVNTPTGQRYDAARDCPSGRCIVEGVVRFRGALADPSATRTERVEALRWLLHLLGDLHQPLHVGDRGDRGGNEIRVSWRGRTLDLHSLWDDELVRAWAVDEGRYLASLRRTVARMTDTERMEVVAGHPADWAAEGNTAAHEIVYPPTSEGIPLGREYLRAAGPVLDRAFIRAGLRLAHVLNEVFDPEAPEPS